MEKIYLFISTERDNQSFIDGLKNSIEVLQSSEQDKFSQNITLRSFRIQCLEDADSNGEIVECCHDWKNKDYEIEIINSSPNSEEFIFNDFFNLADELHKFCDTSYEKGRSLVYVLWCIDKYAPCPSEVVEFYGALQRLRQWCNASLYIISKDSAVIEEWNGAIAFHCAKNATDVLKSSLLESWRGSFGISYEEKAKFDYYPEVTLVCENESYDLFAEEGKKYKGPLYVLPFVEAFSQVDVGSVHLTNILNGSLCYFETSKTCNADQKNVISDILSLCDKDRIGTLLRIRFSTEKIINEHYSSLSTEEWKQAIADGQDISLRSYFKGFHRTLTFMLLPEGISEDKACAIILQDSSVYADDITKLIYQEIERPMESPKENIVEKVFHLLEDTPQFTNLQAGVLFKLLRHVPEVIKQRLQLRHQKWEDLWPETKKQLECLSHQEILKRLECLPFSKVEITFPVSPKPEYATPMETWPEYEALRRDEEQNQKSIDRCHSGDFLAGIPPPPSLDAIVTLDAAQLTKLFSPSGKPAQCSILKMVKYLPKNEIFKTTTSLAEAKIIPWPDSLHTRHHGIYYNRNFQDEKFEQRCCRSRDRYIRHESVSTCSVFGEKESYVNVTKTEQISKRKLPDQGLTLERVRKAPSVKVAEGDSSSCNSVPLKRGKESIKIKPSSMVPEKGRRRSPREKRFKGQFKPSDLLKLEHKSRASSSRAEFNPKPADLSDVHKQKLRNAVLSTLGAEGVHLKHVLFKESFKKLFAVCKPFALDVVGLGSTSSNMEKIAKSHVKQVIEFEKLKKKMR